MAKKSRAHIVETFTLSQEVLDTRTDVDLSDQLPAKASGEKREVKSTCIEMNNKKYWLARRNDGSEFWTDNQNDPKILNHYTGRNRGYLGFLNGDVAKLGGRPKGSSNRVTAKSVCESLGIHPAETLAAILTSDPSLCRKYGIKDVKTISIKDKKDAAKELYARMEGIAKANQLDANGDVSEHINQEREVSNQIQVYIPKRVDQDETTLTFQLNQED